METQVGKEHYHFERYGYLERWVSYHHQIATALSTHPASILEIGVGDGVFGNYIKRKTSISYKSLDIAEELNPDIIGSVLDIPLEDASVDTVCAFEVLEHLPFEHFEQALNELSRVAHRYVVLSLPHFGPPVAFSLKLPLLPEVKILFKIPFPIRHEFNGEHHWEIGKKGYSPSRIRKILQKYGSLERDFVPFGSHYHHFFVIQVG